MTLRHVRIDGSNTELAPNLPSSLSDDPIVDHAISLANAALHTYRGIFPVESPWGYWGRGLELPWFGTFHLPNGSLACSGEPDLDKKFAALVCADVSADIKAYAHAGGAKKDIVQWLAAEVLFNTDRFLTSYCKGDPRTAMLYLSNAYRTMLELSSVVAESFGIELGLTMREDATYKP